MWYFYIVRLFEVCLLFYGEFACGVCGVDKCLQYIIMIEVWLSCRVGNKLC